MSSDNIYDTTERLPDGYDGQNVPDDFYLPPCGLADIDRAVFDLFDKKINFTISQHKETRSVPVIFAGGERFALTKGTPFRDKNGTFILPLVSIARTSIDQSMNLGGLGRGIGQDVGDLVIKKRLDKRDRRYQAIKNKLNLQNQTDFSDYGRSAPSEVTDDGTTVDSLRTARNIGRRRTELERGEILSNRMTDNIIEIITIPYPEFFSLKYEVTLWTQHQQHMNSIIEQMLGAYHAQGHQFRIDTDKGYWFVAFIDDAITSGDNFEDYAEDERIIKYSFNITTTGYLVAPDHEGQRSALRKFISAPTITFDLYDSSPDIFGPRPLGAGSGDPDQFVLSDVVELDRGGNEAIGRNHSPYGRFELIEDPFSGDKERRFFRVKTRNQRKGETVFGVADVLTHLGIIQSD